MTEFYLNFKEVNVLPIKNKKIISFSLYGVKSHITDYTKRDFYKGVYINYHLAKTIYPDYIIRVYMPDSEPQDVIERIKSFKDIELILVSTNICLRALRFLPHDDEDVEVWLSRDLDSVVNLRERAAVDEWLNSYKDRELHIMTDHEQHRWTIAGGMFGFKNRACKRSILNFMLDFSKRNCDNNSYAVDCDIAEEFFFKNCKYIQHHSAGKVLPCSISFPKHDKVEPSFVGCIIDTRLYFHNMKLSSYYPLLNLKLNLKIANGDLFYYKPWEANCKALWYNKDDFILVPIKTDKSTCSDNSFLKTTNGTGQDLLNGKDIDITWDGIHTRQSYAVDDNTIAVVHNEVAHYFARVISIAPDSF